MEKPHFAERVVTVDCEHQSIGRCANQGNHGQSTELNPPTEAQVVHEAGFQSI